MHLSCFEDSRIQVSMNNQIWRQGGRGWKWPWIFEGPRLCQGLLLPMPEYYRGLLSDHCVHFFLISYSKGWRCTNRLHSDKENLFGLSKVIVWIGYAGQAAPWIREHRGLRLLFGDLMMSRRRSSLLVSCCAASVVLYSSCKTWVT